MKEPTRRNIEDALRFMRVPKSGYEQMRHIAEEGFRQVAKYAQPRKVYATFPLEVAPDGISIGDGSITCPSKNLARIFANCKSCIAMAVTLGPAIDRQTQLLSRTDMAKTIAFDACASVWADTLCVDVEKEIQAGLSPDEHLTMRYSPGYGDVPMEFSGDIIRLLDATRKIGLTLSSRGMMIPIKSVTALVGISPIQESRRHSCEGCSPQSCPYRRDGEVCYEN